MYMYVRGERSCICTKCMLRVSILLLFLQIFDWIMKLFWQCGIFNSPCQRQSELLPSLGVRRLSSVDFSHFNLLLLNPLSHMNWNLVGRIYGRSSIKITHFVPIHLQTWPLQAILVSDWPIFSSPDPKGHVSYCHHWASVVRLSIR